MTNRKRQRRRKRCFHFISDWFWLVFSFSYGPLCSSPRGSDARPMSLLAPIGRIELQLLLSNGSFFERCSVGASEEHMKAACEIWETLYLVCEGKNSVFPRSHLNYQSENGEVDPRDFVEPILSSVTLRLWPRDCHSGTD